MKGISAATHAFRRGTVDDDGSCLYASFRDVNNTVNTIKNQCLRSMVAGHIRKHQNLHPAVLGSGTSCKTVEEYCNKIEKHNLRGGEPEVRALAMLSRTLIRLVSRTKTAEGEYVTNILNYGEDIKSFEKCVFIFYDEENKHYDPLYVINTEKLDEKLTIFQRDDQVVNCLLDVFIRNEFNDDYNMLHEKELPTGTNLLNETEEISNLIVPTTNMNFSNKRKLGDHAGLTFAKTTEQELFSRMPPNRDVVDKPKKLAKRDTDDIPARGKLITSNVIQFITQVDDNKCESVTIEQHLQTNFLASEDDIEMVQQATAASSIILTKNHPEQIIKLEVEPALKFLGRTPGDFKPKKPQNRKGELAEARPPRYFPDRDNHRYFNLLIPERHLSPNAEYCLRIDIITREINGCSYIHPYFKFQGHPTDKNIPDENPRYILFNMADLKDHSEGIKKLLIQFVVVMHTNPELMQSQQPLPIFSSSTNGSVITGTYDNQRAFKAAYHLHDLRFAMTLCKKQPGETEFRPCEDIQYISEISTEDKRTKIRN